MFNWKPNEPKVEIPQHQHPVYENEFHRLKELILDIDKKWERDRADLWKAIKDLSDAANKPAPPANIAALEQRLAVLDTWRAQLHTLLVERGNTGKEKLSRTGNALSKFYGGR